MAGQYDENLILGYVEGDLSPEDRARAEAVLAQDPRLAALVVGMVQDCVALRSLPREVPPGDLVDDVLGRVERNMLLGNEDESRAPRAPAARTFRLSRLFAYGGLAAMLLISGGVLTFVLSTHGLLETAQEHADAGRFFDAYSGEDRARAESARAAGDSRIALAERARETSAPEVPAASSVAAAPSGTPLPEMAHSVEQMALAQPEPQAAAAPRLRRYQGPLVIRGDGQPRWDHAVHAGAEPLVQPAPVWVKVLAHDAEKARQEVIASAASNHAVVMEGTPHPAVLSGSLAEAQRGGGGQGGDGRSGRVMMVQVPAERAVEFVQSINRDGHEAGLVPVGNTVVFHRGERPAPLQESNLIARQVAATQGSAGEQAAEALTLKLEDLQRRVVARQKDQHRSRLGVREGPVRSLAAASPGRDRGEDAVRGELGDGARQASSLTQNLQYFQVFPDVAAGPLAGLDLTGAPLTIPVIISEWPRPHTEADDAP